jgi:hypothetical protein
MPMHAEGRAGAAARRFVEEYNRGSAGWVYAVHAEGFAWHELPVHGVYPGHTGDREDLRKLLQETIERFPGRRMELLDVIADGDRAAFQIEWTGPRSPARTTSPRALPSGCGRRASSMSMPRVR